MRSNFGFMLAMNKSKGKRVSVILQRRKRASNESGVDWFLLAIYKSKGKRASVIRYGGKRTVKESVERERYGVFNMRNNFG